MSDHQECQHIWLRNLECCIDWCLKCGLAVLIVAESFLSAIEGTKLSPHPHQETPRMEASLEKDVGFIQIGSGASGDRVRAHRPLLDIQSDGAYRQPA